MFIIDLSAILGVITELVPIIIIIMIIRMVLAILKSYIDEENKTKEYIKTKKEKDGKNDDSDEKITQDNLPEGYDEAESLW